MEKIIKNSKYIRYKTKKDKRGYFHKLYNYNEYQKKIMLLARFYPECNKFKEIRILKNKIESIDYETNHK